MVLRGLRRKYQRSLQARASSRGSPSPSPMLLAFIPPTPTPTLLRKNSAQKQTVDEAVKPVAPPLLRVLAQAKLGPELLEVIPGDRKGLRKEKETWAGEAFDRK